MTYDPIISFRMAPADYEKLAQYAEDHRMNISEVIRRAIRWMMILNDKETRR